MRFYTRADALLVFQKVDKDGSTYGSSFDGHTVSSKGERVAPQVNCDVLRQGTTCAVQAAQDFLPIEFVTVRRSISFSPGATLGCRLAHPPVRVRTTILVNEMP